MSMPHRLTPIQLPEEVPEDNQSMSPLCSGACSDSSLALQHNPHSYWANHRPEELALTCPTSTPPPMSQPQPTGSFWLLFIQLLTHTHTTSPPQAFETTAPLPFPTQLLSLHALCLKRVGALGHPITLSLALVGLFRICLITGLLTFYLWSVICSLRSPWSSHVSPILLGSGPMAWDTEGLQWK